MGGEKKCNTVKYSMIIWLMAGVLCFDKNGIKGAFLYVYNRLEISVLKVSSSSPPRILQEDG